MGMAKISRLRVAPTCIDPSNPEPSIAERQLPRGKAAFAPAAGLFPVLLQAAGTAGRDITVWLALAGSHPLHVRLIGWSIGIILAVGYALVAYWLFRGKVSPEAEGYGH